jgi:hypothetical protein
MTNSTKGNRTVGMLAAGLFAAVVAGGMAAPAQAFEVNGPGFHVWLGGPDRYYGNDGYRGGGYDTWNGCPPRWTVQGGVCKPYHYGPADYGYRY